MKQTLANIIRLMRQLRQWLPLFTASTIVTALSQLTVVGITVTSVWISTRLFVDMDASLVGLIAVLLGLIVAHSVGTLLEVWWSHEVAYWVCIRSESIFIARLSGSLRWACKGGALVMWPRQP